MIAVGPREQIKPLLETQFPEFAGKGQGSWTSLDVPSRIRAIGEKVSYKACPLIEEVAWRTPPLVADPLVEGELQELINTLNEWRWKAVRASNGCRRVHLLGRAP
jgi:hypothetical protein